MLEWQLLMHRRTAKGKGRGEGAEGEEEEKKREGVRDTMTKLVRNRGSGVDLEALLRSSSHAALHRFVLHTLLCIVALVLGFSLSKEALLVVLSFKIPHGSLFVKTTTHTHSHEVSITSLPHLKQTSPASESEFNVSHHIEQSSPLSQAEKTVSHPKEPILPLSEAKIMSHHAETHIPSLHSPRAVTPPPATTSKSSSVHVGRHEILIRPWPHPDPLQTVVAHHLIDLVQEEQRHSYGFKERKQLLIITPTYVETLQSVHLTCLIHTLRLVPSPLIWIVVEAGGVSNETAALLLSSKLSFHHLSLQEAMPTDSVQRLHFEVRLRVEGLRFIREQLLDGVVVFADYSNTYSLDFFDEVQKVNWVGAFSIGVLPHSGSLKSLKVVPEETQDGLLVAVAKVTNRSSNLISLQSSACNSSGHVVGWHASMENGTSQGIGSIRSLEWSVFAFNARLLWVYQELPTWIRSWNELFGGNHTLVRSPLDFVKNSSHIEPLGRCGCFK